MIRKIWTNEDKEFLRKNYFSLGAAKCAEKMERTYESVKKKAQILGIKGNKSKRFSHEKHEQQLLERDAKAFPVETYITNRIPILYECVEGHQWKARPDSILAGTGCPYCAEVGFNSSKTAILYYVEINKGNKLYYKVGVTNNTIYERFAKEIHVSIRILHSEFF